jgi:hypothetical protein
MKKETEMRKIIASLAVAGALVASPAMAGGGHHGGHHGGGFSPWVPFIAGAGIVYFATRPQVVYAQPQVVYQQPQVVYQQVPAYSYPTQAPVIQTPGTVCELKSEMINGQVVTGNFCYQYQR